MLQSHDFAPGAAPRAIVAIPVRDEAERLSPCLGALAAQCGARDMAVVLLFNNCTDASDRIAAAMRPGLPFALRTLRIDLPPHEAHVGTARSLAMKEAARLFAAAGRHDGIILTTDADSRVASDWLSANLAAFRAGADAVAGFVEIDTIERRRLPGHMVERLAAEQAYDSLLAELEARLDPLDHDPLPRHRMASGASLALTLQAYCRIGGMPRVALAEDRALVAALRGIDAHVRHDPNVRVTTSCRVLGRARGGAADTIRLRSLNPASPCDPTLEAAFRAGRRAWWRGRLRALQARDGLHPTGQWVACLRLSHAAAARASAARSFGRAWDMIETASPLLHRRPLNPLMIARETRRAEVMLSMLRAGAAVSQIAAMFPGDRLVPAAAS